MEELKTFTPTQEELESSAFATIETNKGAIVVRLFGESAPQAVSNFAFSCQKWILQWAYIPPRDRRLCRSRWLS